MDQEKEKDELLMALAEHDIWPDLQSRQVVKVWERVDLRLVPVRVADFVTGAAVEQVILVARIDLPGKDGERPQSILCEIEAAKFLRAAEELRFGEALEIRRDDFPPDHLEPRGRAAGGPRDS